MGRYATQNYIDADGTKSYEFRQTPRTLYEGQYANYTVKQGDRLDLLAYREYGDHKKWYIIADVNEEIKFGLDLEVGSVIKIPLKRYVNQYA